MKIAKIKFGQTHVVTNMGDKFKGKQTIVIPCIGDYELSKHNTDRIEVFGGTADNVGCPECRHSLGLDGDENAD